MRLKPSLRAIKSQSNPYLWIAASLLLLAMTAQTFAEEQKPEEPTKTETPKGFTYSPEYCEFSTTFPEEPYTLHICDPEIKDKCYDELSYTQVFEMASTVRFRVVCNPADSSMFEKYSPEVMHATLKAMTHQHFVKEIDASARNEDGYKQAGLVAEGKEGLTDKIYIAQLWIGRQSVMSVEAEMIGAPVDSADALFSQLLANVHYSGVKKPDAP